MKNKQGLLGEIKHKNTEIIPIVVYIRRESKKEG